VLGKRGAAGNPLAKVEALDEAKSWLRELTQEAADARLDQMTRGMPRSKKKKPLKEQPFQHPHDWAAFVLIGDPA
jgi:CHAT domain-containing protein